MSRRDQYSNLRSRVQHSAPAAPSDSDNDETPRPSVLLSSGRESRGWINDEEWRINIQPASDERHNVDHLRSQWDVSIFRVPNFLKRSTKGGNYVPRIVSLGPYHHRNKRLSPMDKHKGRALHRMMARFNINHANDPNNTDFSSLAEEEILKLEDKIRKTYEEKIDCNAQTLARMLCLDGCFTLEILRTLGNEQFPVAEVSNYYEPIFERNKIDYTGFDIMNDILMLENQIPLSVLRKLLELELNSSNNVETKLFKMLVNFPKSKFYPFRYNMKDWSWPQPRPHPQPVAATAAAATTATAAAATAATTATAAAAAAATTATAAAAAATTATTAAAAAATTATAAAAAATTAIATAAATTATAAAAGATAAATIQHQQPAQQIGEVQISHLLGLLHALIVSPPCRDGDDPANEVNPRGLNRVENVVSRIPRAVELIKAGVKFKRCSGGIQKIKFEQKSGIIYLPPIQITDYTEVLFRNLIAFELCKASEINYVTCYLTLMDELVDSEEDVAVLRKSDIIINYLGSDAEVAELLNSLCSGVTMSRRDAFQQLKGQVYEHYKSKFKVWSAELVKKYFSSPWKSLALAGSILLLVLTTLQTIFTIIGTEKQGNTQH